MLPLETVDFLDDFAENSLESRGWDGDPKSIANTLGWAPNKESESPPWGDLSRALLVGAGHRAEPAIVRQLTMALRWPKSSLLNIWKYCKGDLPSVASAFNCSSLDLICLRVLSLNPSFVGSLTTGRQILWRTTWGPTASSRLEPLEAICLERVQACSRPCSLSDNDITAKCWPWHSIDKRQEVMLLFRAELT